VCGKVATKEHGEFALAMDMIDVMPPGLYEAVISSLDKSVENHGHPSVGSHRSDVRRSAARESSS
jgi:hypothetical protein